MTQSPNRPERTAPAAKPSRTDVGPATTPASAATTAEGGFETEMDAMTQHCGSTDVDHLSGHPAEGTDGPNDHEAEAPETLAMYVRLHPRWAATSRCRAALTSLMARHRDVEVEVAGLSTDAKGLHLTLGVSLGPAAEIARFSETATQAYNFVAAIFEVMFDYLPQYAPEPSAEERAAVADLHLEALSDGRQEPSAAERAAQPSDRRVRAAA